MKDNYKTKIANSLGKDYLNKIISNNKKYDKSILKAAQMKINNGYFNKHNIRFRIVHKEIIDEKIVGLIFNSEVKENPDLNVSFYVALMKGKEIPLDYFDSDLVKLNEDILNFINKDSCIVEFSNGETNEILKLKLKLELKALGREITEAI